MINPELAEMIWSDGVYRAFMERYANLGNNSGYRYRRASATMLQLFQFLDGLNSQTKLYSQVEEILNSKDTSADVFLSKEILIYDKNVRNHVEMVAGEKYLSRLSEGKINPLSLVVLAGCGDVEAYEVLRQLYDEKVMEYNRWFYSSAQDQYLPPTFDDLFNPNY